MKKTEKLLLSVIMSFILTFSSASFIYAEETTEQTKQSTEASKNSNENNDELSESEKEAEYAGEYVEYIVNMINSLYVGSDINTKQLIEAAIRGMTSAMDDYTEYFTEEEYEKYIKNLSSQVYAIGVMYRFAVDSYPVITEVISQSPAEKSGIYVGDSIISLNGEDLKGKKLDEVAASIPNADKHNITLVISRNGVNITKTLSMEQVKVQSVYVNNIEDVYSDINPYVENSRIAYIKITSISDKTGVEFSEAVKTLTEQGKTKIIIDLRSNTGGFVDQALKICRELVPAGPILFTKDKNGKVIQEDSQLEKCPFDNIVVLTNGMTASSSEIIASALQDSGVAKIVGTQTYGKGVMQTIVTLPDGYGKLKITMYEYFSRDGKKINQVGITPDIVVNTAVFLTDDDTIESEDVKVILNKLGYIVNNQEDAAEALKKFQSEKGLTDSEGLDNKTKAALNQELYNLISEYDEVLARGYDEVIK